MAAYRRVYDSRHLEADCQEPGSAPEPYARQSSMGCFFTHEYDALRVSRWTGVQHAPGGTMVRKRWPAFIFRPAEGIGGCVRGPGLSGVHNFPHHIALE